MSEKILVVDDDVESLKLISLMLKRQGYDVAIANSGSQALAKASTEQPNLIILDVMMMDMDGYEVCRRLRGNPETRPIPIIMFTAKTLIDDKVAGFEAGADDYLTKPTHPAELASRIKAVLARNQTSSQSVRPTGVAIGVLGAKGGIGTTTVAVNLAAGHQQNKMRPILVDFQLGAGHAGLSLGLQKLDGMATVINKPVNEIKAPLLMQNLVTHSSGLRVLAASPDPREAQLKFTPDAATAIIKGLKGIGNPIVIDLGAGYSELTSRLLPALDRLVILVEPVAMVIAAAEHLINAIKNDFSKPIHIVVIHRQPLARGMITWSDVEARLGQSVAGMISAAPELTYQAMEAGVPIVIHQPGAVIANQFMKLAQTIPG
jgi:CheY-like chemotaxis protein/MinD-like ATPase involved in chromosome partitioning or flagellar assembly